MLHIVLFLKRKEIQEKTSKRFRSRETEVPILIENLRKRGIIQDSTVHVL